MAGVGDICGLLKKDCVAHIVLFEFYSGTVVLFFTYECEPPCWTKFLLEMGDINNLNKLNK